MPEPLSSNSLSSSVLTSDTLDTPAFRWVGLKKLTWQDPAGNRREWECAFRTTRRSECDGVAVVAFVRYPTSKKLDEVLLVTQFRPPVASQVRVLTVSYRTRDVRWLKLLRDWWTQAKPPPPPLSESCWKRPVSWEKVSCVSPIVPCDPGMTDANMRYVIIDVNGDAEENQNPKANPDDGEFITVRRLPATRFQEGLDSMDDAGFQIDARLYAMALGYTLGRRSYSAASAGPGDADGAVPVKGAENSNSGEGCQKLGLGIRVGLGLACALVATAVGALIAGAMCPGKRVSLQEVAR